MNQGAMPAYPVECQRDDGLPVHGRQTSNSTGWVTGLTKREVFAMAAMQAMLSNDSISVTDKSISAEQAIANASIVFADALLAALSDQPTRQEDAQP